MTPNPFASESIHFFYLQYFLNSNIIEIIDFFQTFDLNEFPSFTFFQKMIKNEWIVINQLF